MRDRVNTEADGENDQSGSNPDGPTQRWTEVADDEDRRGACDLIAGRYPGRLTAGERETALDRRDSDAKQSVDCHRLEEHRDTCEEQEPARTC